MPVRAASDSDGGGEASCFYSPSFLADDGAVLFYWGIDCCGGACMGIGTGIW